MKKPAVAIRNLQNSVPFSDERRKAGTVYSPNIKKLIFKTLELRPLIRGSQISVLLAGDKMIRELNSRYLHKDNPTDVLAFDLSRGRGDISCEIVVSSDAAVRNSRIYRTSPVYEIYLYVVHGLLHMLGYNDNTAGKREIMQKKAELILSKFTSLL